MSKERQPSRKSSSNGGRSINIQPENKQIKQSILENVQVSGGGIHVESVIQIGSQTVVNQESNFFEIDLEPFNSSNFESPQISRELLKILKRNNLIVLGDGIDIDKSTLSKHIGALLAEALSKSDRKFTIKEWSKNSEALKIEAEFEKDKAHQIIFINQVSPQDILDYSLSTLQRIAASKKHFILVTTDLPFSAWRLVDNCKGWWRDLSPLDLQDCPKLVNQLSTDESINDWYYRKLSSKEQLLVIGLIFFDGLFDDQFFSALEKVVLDSWKDRDSNLNALDYCDLDNLLSYFDFIDAGERRTLVKIRFPKQRITSLKIIWKSHRRQILSALPTLVNLIKGTSIRPDGELYGSPERCNKIRQVLGEAISEIGLVSLLDSREAVQDSLLTLAASSDIRVQAVAAQAMASWRKHDKHGLIPEYSEIINADKELFSTLNKWQQESLSNSFIYSFIDGKLSANQGNKPASYIRATIAITIGYASLYDSDDELSSELLALFKKLSKDSDTLVRDRFKSYSIPFFIAGHLQEIKSIIRELASNGDFIPEISESLAFTFKFNPITVTNLLGGWKRECDQYAIDRTPKNRMGEREYLVKVIALTYSQIDYSSEFGQKNFQYAANLLIDILKYERHQLVRNELITALLELFGKDIEGRAEKLREALVFFSSSERIQAIGRLKKLYLEQRLELTGGDAKVKIDDVIYSSWSSPKSRPETKVERILLKWMKDASNEHSQSFAIQTLIAFSKSFEIEETKQISILNEQSKRKTAKTNNPKVFAGTRKIYYPLANQSGIYLSKIIPWLTTRKRVDYRPSISNLLPEIHSQNISDSASTEFFLSKISNAKDPYLKNTSLLLKRGLILSNYVLVACITAGLGASILLWRGITGLRELGSSIEQESISSDMNNNIEEGETETLNTNSNSPELNPFSQVNFPIAACGDPLPAEDSLYPIQYYPVYVAYSDVNLAEIRSSFCQDAFRRTQEGTNLEVIQIASFISRQQALLFQEFLAQYFVGVEVGNSSIIEDSPTASTPLTILSKGTIQFSPGSISTHIEERFNSPNIHQFTITASASQSSSITINSSSNQMFLEIISPSGINLANSQSRVNSWNGRLPDNGIYTIRVIGFQAPSAYRLSVVIQP